MALRSLNSTVPDRRTSMRRAARLPSLVGSNDENVDLRWCPNRPPPCASAKPLPLPVCSEPPPCKPSPSPESPSEASVSVSCQALPSAPCCEGSAAQSCKLSPSLVCTEVSSSEPTPSPAYNEACILFPLSREPCRSPSGNETSTSAEPSAEVEYILSEHLPHLADCDDVVSTLLGRLDSKDWLKVCEAINHMRQLSIYHKSSILQLLDKAVLLLVKATKNPRSALCKTAIMASADLFRAFPEEILDLLEQLLLQLLLKASQDKRFVCEEAERSLEVMTTCLHPASLLVLLKPYVMHRNPRVRAKAATCVYRSVSKLGSEGIHNFGFRPLLQIASSQLNDQLPEARESARKLVAELYAAYPGPLASASADSVTNHQDWNQFCNAHLSSHFAQAVLRLTADC